MIADVDIEIDGDGPVACTVCERPVSALMVGFDGACPDCLDTVDQDAVDEDNADGVEYPAAA